MRILGILACTTSIVWAIPTVKVALRTSWPAPPLLMEIIETIGLLNPDAYFPALDTLTDPMRLAESRPANDEALYRWAISTARNIGVIQETAFLEAQLALHAAVPKLEAFYQQHSSIQGLPGSEECRSWVDWYGTIICDVEELVHRVGHAAIDANHTTATSVVPPYPKLSSHDHVYHSLSGIKHPDYAAILHGDISSPNFRALHNYLLSVASSPEGRIAYVFRPGPSSSRDAKDRTHLSGYGVALDLKKMEYLAIDDRHTGGDSTTTTKPDGSEDDVAPDMIIDLLNKYPLSDTLDTSSPLTEEEFSYLGYQAMQSVLSAENPLEALEGLSQNFPKYATTMARRVVVDDELEREARSNGMKAQPGISAAWLNGVMLSEGDMNPFALMRLILKERAIVGVLTELGLTPGQGVALLTHSTLAKSQSGTSVEDGIVDASDRPEGGHVIVWWNDFNKDGRYESWKPSIHGLLQPLYPGQFHSIRLNLWNIVIVADLSLSSTANWLASISNIIARRFPFRFGLVPLCETDDARRMALFIWYLTETYGPVKALEFFKSLQSPPSSSAHVLDWSFVKQIYDQWVQPLSHDSSTDGDADSTAPVLTLEQFMGDATNYESRLAAARAYSERLSARSIDTAAEGHAFVNGKHFNLDEDFFRAMQGELGQQLQHMQEKVYGGEIGDEEAQTIDTYWFDLPSTTPRRNKYIFPDDQISPLRVTSLSELASTIGPFKGFIYPESSAYTPITVQVLGDFDHESSAGLLKESLHLMIINSVARMSFWHVPSSQTDRDSRPLASSLLSHLMAGSSSHLATPQSLLAALGYETPVVNDITEGKPILQQDESLQQLLNGRSVNEIDSRQYDRYISISRDLYSKIGAVTGQQAFIINGRVVGPFPAGSFQAADINVLINYELRKRVGPVMEALFDIQGHEKEGLSSDSFAEVIAAASSLISALQIQDPTETGIFNKPYRARQRNYHLLGGEHVRFAVGDNATALAHFGVIVDPLSESAQKWSSLFQWALRLPGVFVEFYIHPAAYKEIPLKRFYRYNLLKELPFTENGDIAENCVSFEDLPTAPIYTAAMDVPISWVVRPREAPHDMDNLQLGHLLTDQEVKAVYDLDYLVVEGHARETGTVSPPRGLQLQLSTKSGQVIDDTQVVATLGYLQFKVKPGVFYLEIREGRGRDIYSIDSVGNEGWNSPSVNASGNDITVASFDGVTLYPRFNRVPGAEKLDVLASATTSNNEESKDEQGGIIGSVISRISSLFKTDKKEEAPVTDLVVKPHNNTRQADINIFTVASGLLYERFSSIMILSVLRNTNSTVKFWFIENFLSPSFLEFIPHFAQEYNFQYELVTYKWPSWLRAQKEKQRIIWAYKILFLDVLFPMDLEKVIFVDADQIVRTDMKELVDLDLHGAPYGYTPMGDDNYDMEGFRFWKTGYWKDFLQGLPYHISALYVVDLVKFRQMAAGDILRQTYQQLSADPNSLANLDQDLPNNLQREVPIFSLGEDWLWCETWCSKDRLHRAKTIDLCQNPLTKEPKLTRARSIPEWEEYDGEIANFTRNLVDRGLIRSASSADINELAGEVKSNTVTDDVPAAEPQTLNEGTGGQIHEEL